MPHKNRNNLYHIRIAETVYSLSNMTLIIHKIKIVRLIGCHTFVRLFSLFMAFVLLLSKDKSIHA